LVIGYTLMVGLSFGNLGIIARQRAPMFPFLLLLLLGAEEPVTAPARGRGRTRRAVSPGFAADGSAPATG
jgi:hypothetical protein